MFLFVITKNSNSEILTKNLITFKRSDRVKDEKCWYFSDALKNQIFRVDGDRFKKDGLDSLQI